MSLRRSRPSSSRRSCGTTTVIGPRTPSPSPRRPWPRRPGSRSVPTCGSSSSSRPRSARQHPFSSEKLGVVLSMFRYAGFDDALAMVEAIYEVGGKGHSCGIYSFDDDHIDRLARLAPVSRIMVRQPQSKANAGAFNNGMPMTSSLGCGTWGGNITSENIHLKHYMNTTWVSRPIAEDRPSEAGALRRVLRDGARLMSVLAKATEILDLVADAPDEATLTSIAQRLGQPRSSTHRLLSELVQLGLLFRVGTASYVPGPRLTALGRGRERRRTTSSASRGHRMVRLRDADGESVHLYVRQRDRRVCVSAIEGNFELRHFTEVGQATAPLGRAPPGSCCSRSRTRQPRPSSCAASRGSRLATGAGAGRADRPARGDPRSRAGPCPSGSAKRGWRQAAVPIRNLAGAVQAALAISGPTGRLTAERLVDLRPQLSAAADEISAAQGWKAAPLPARLR